MGVNYGVNKVRFSAPVPVGSRLRATVAEVPGSILKRRKSVIHSPLLLWGAGVQAAT
jgi:acyl dehydratase